MYKPKIDHTFGGSPPSPPPFPSLSCPLPSLQHQSAILYLVNSGRLWVSTGINNIYPGRYQGRENQSVTASCLVVMTTVTENVTH